VNRLEILPFGDEHLDDGGRLLPARRARHRAAEPLLSSRFWPRRGFRQVFLRMYRAIP
jgi:hypothetical protein